ncbi:hypothetical protein TrRE_jg2452 [Triparma retinervis]|uniref:Uncharacterized protein n=1 Tax=Triparma retinervis TaxID=2557542 RepID=A0A9W7A3S8_9STRA|nr:hypothetical protein TrRE_jg2452 [Triparma retinervis]
MPGIFFNKENLQLSLPLIAICTTYAYFKFLPLIVALPLLCVLGLVYRGYLSYKANQRVAILRSLESDSALASASAISSLMAGEDLKDAKAASKKEKKKNKKKQKEFMKRKAEAKNGGGLQNIVSQSGEDEESEDDGDFDVARIVKQNSKKGR